MLQEWFPVWLFPKAIDTAWMSVERCDEVTSMSAEASLSDVASFSPGKKLTEEQLLSRQEQLGEYLKKLVKAANADPGRKSSVSREVDGFLSVEENRAKYSAAM